MGKEGDEGTSLELFFCVCVVILCCNVLSMLGVGIDVSLHHCFI